MAVKIRLARGGSKKRPYYRIVAATDRAPRDGQFLEKLGTYNPMLDREDKTRVTLVKDRLNHWLKEGAQPTDRVLKFLMDAKIDIPAGIKSKFEIRKKVRTTKPSKKEAKELAEKAS